MVTKLSYGFQSEDIINSIHVMNRIIMLFFQGDCVRGCTFFQVLILFTIDESFSSTFRNDFHLWSKISYGRCDPITTIHHHFASVQKPIFFLEKLR